MTLAALVGFTPYIPVDSNFCSLGSPSMLHSRLASHEGVSWSRNLIYVQPPMNWRALV